MAAEGSLRRCRVTLLKMYLPTGLLRHAEHAPSLAPTIGAAFDPESSRITSEEAPVDVALNVSQPAVSLEEHFESQRSRERPNL